MAKARVRGTCRVVAFVVGVSLLGATQAAATIQLGDALLFGDISAQNLFRMRDVGDFTLVQQRNTLRVGLDYKWLNEGKVVGKYGAQKKKEKSSVYALYRGVYDSVYDLIADTRGEEYIRTVSKYAWVCVGPGKYILQTPGKGFLRLERSGDMYTVTVTRQLPDGVLQIRRAYQDRSG